MGIHPECMVYLPTFTPVDYPSVGKYTIQHLGFTFIYTYIHYSRDFLFNQLQPAPGIRRLTSDAGHSDDVVTRRFGYHEKNGEAVLVDGNSYRYLSGKFLSNYRCLRIVAKNDVFPY